MRRFVPILAVPLLAAAAVAPSTRTADAPDADPAAAAPISYFNANCASCHGDYGSFWGDGFAAEYDDAELREVVAEMAAGPGFAPIDGAALDAQTAYNRSLAAGDGSPPFLVAATATGGEVTPGSTVTLETDAGEVAATVAGHRWHAEVDSKIIAAIAERGGQTTRLELTGKLPIWSHGPG